MKLERIDTSDTASTQELTEQMIARFSSSARQEQSTRTVSRIEQRPPFKTKTIDSARIPIQNSPSKIAFVGSVGIGTPPQYFHVDFDIASADTWVAVNKANCTDGSNSKNAKPCPLSRRLFHASRSLSFEKAPNVDWSIEFSDHSKVFGQLHTETVHVAGYTVEKQVIALGTSLQGFKETGIDGSLGLGLPELAANGDPSPPENMIAVNGMKSEIGIWLGDESQGGELVFGGKDTARFTGDLTYFEVPVGSAYWSVPVHSLSIVPLPPKPKPSTSTPLSSPSSNITVIVDTNLTTATSTPTTSTVTPTPTAPLATASGPEQKVESRTGGATSEIPNIIFDTSSNIILVPPRVAKRTHQYLHNWLFGWYSGYNLFTGTYSVPCNLNVDIYFDIGVRPNDNSTSTETNSTTATATPTPTTTRFKIAGKDIVRERMPVIGGVFNLCASGIQASKNDEDDWVFGNTWFLNNYMTLNHRKRRIGIAPAIRLEDEDA
ncbi:hypothetical protein BGZ94_001555 [Podila epigama]|nr:hypothetical protein BGZ94_001555 [Podila epigama]